MNLEVLLEEAGRKDPTAMFELAEAYFWGNEIPEDNEKAFAMYKELEAIPPVKPVVLFRLGNCYLRGIGTEKDVDLGLTYCNKAADQGSQGACRVLGEVYFNGEEVPRDPEKGIAYYIKGAELGEVVCQSIAGQAFLRGYGQGEHILEGEKLLIKAAEQGNVAALYELGKLYWQGTKEIPKDTEKAIHYLKIIAEADLEDYEHIDAVYQILGNLCASKDTSEGIDESLKWFNKSADRGNGDSAYKAILAAMIGIDATVMAASHMNDAMAWDIAREEMMTVHGYFERFDRILQAGKWSMDQEFIDSVARHKAELDKYIAISCFHCKRYAEALKYLPEGGSLSNRVLRATCILCNGDRSAGRGLYSTIRELETESTYDPEAEGGYAGEFPYAISMLFIANLHRDAGGRDLEIAVNVLNKAINKLKDQNAKNMLINELGHYQKKLLGGYRYV